MSELIYKQDAIDLVKDVCDAIMSGCNSHYDSETGDEVYDDILEVDAILKCNKEIRIALGNLPSAEPRKRGKWIPLQLSIAHPLYQCSCCSKNAPMVETGSLVNRYLEALLTDFCPNCGADMRGEEE